ncbi:hypothetical protein BH24CHL1_BH24CHL1_08840 [soil metagenome]
MNGRYPIARKRADHTTPPRSRHHHWHTANRRTHNAVTDVPGVRIGHSTIVEGDAVRTGVTAVHPLEGSAFSEMPPAAIQILNGAGEITGRSQVDEYGLLESPILITNTLSVGTAHRGCIEWMRQQEPTLGPIHFSIPVVAETYDGFLNDIGGQHVTIEHVFDALDSATGGPVAEGNVGGGTGMMLFGFKGGIGTSSRLVTVEDREYTVGVLVQGNFGIRGHLLVDCLPFGREITDLLPERNPHQGTPARDGSIIVLIATDAPLSDRQLARLCRGGDARSRSGRVDGDARFRRSADRLLECPGMPGEPLRHLGRAHYPTSRRPPARPLLPGYRRSHCRIGAQRIGHRGGYDRPRRQPSVRVTARPVDGGYAKVWAAGKLSVRWLRWRAQQFKIRYAFKVLAVTSHERQIAVESGGGDEKIGERYQLAGSP